MAVATAITAGVAALAAVASVIVSVIAMVSARRDGRFEALSKELGGRIDDLKAEVGAVEIRLGARIDRGDDRLERQIAELRRPLMWSPGGETSRPRTADATEPVGAAERREAAEVRSANPVVAGGVEQTVTGKVNRGG